jgi:hypothetical protein
MIRFNPPPLRLESEIHKIHFIVKGTYDDAELEIPFETDVSYNLTITHPDHKSKLDVEEVRVVLSQWFDNI